MNFDNTLSQNAQIYQRASKLDFKASSLGITIKNHTKKKLNYVNSGSNSYL